MLSIKNIIKKFNGKNILDDISFNVSPGQIVVLLGQSGVGKSTVLRLLNNLESLDSGTIELDNESINFKKVGMVFQEFNLFNHLTIEENITLPLIIVALKSIAEAQKISCELLTQLGLKSHDKSYPCSLSGGQKQRAALARTLAMNPKVLCLDEPTSALDPQLKSEIAQIINNLAKQGYIIVMTSHDVNLIKQLTCTIHLMQNGKIIESATTDELQQNINNFINIKKFIIEK